MADTTFSYLTTPGVGGCLSPLDFEGVLKVELFKENLYRMRKLRFEHGTEQNMLLFRDIMPEGLALR